MQTVPTAGVDGFVAGLLHCDTNAELRGNIVVFAVEAVVGRLAGTLVESGVEVAELAMWPMAPPHWIHLPEDIVFTHTNSDRSECLPGWVRHSRQIACWGDAAEPAQAWLGHVRGVLAEVP